jgi:type IV secretory pathway VirJ component
MTPDRSRRILLSRGAATSRGSALARARVTAGAAHAQPPAEILQRPRIGAVSVHRPARAAKGLVILLGDSGPDRARLSGLLLDLSYLVAEVDSQSYATHLEAGASPCAAPGEDLRSLAARLAKRLPADSRRPLLLGLGDGAAFAYAALAQSSPDAFHAAIGVDFCPHLALRLALCQTGALSRPGAVTPSGQEIEPATGLSTSYFAFQEADPPHCDAAQVAAFMAHADNMKVSTTPTRGGDLTPLLPDLEALLQWLDPSIEDQVTGQGEVGDIALQEAPAADARDERMAVMLSGDGGWAALDRGVAAELNRRGISVVGWDSLRYFWKRRSPEEAARDLARVLEHYLAAWHKRRVVLVGYSFGADVLPFLVTRLPPAVLAKIERVVFLGLGPTATFEFHLSEWLGTSDTQDSRPVAEEIRRLPRDTRFVCLYGADEADQSACPGLTSFGVSVHALPGDHHFADDYARIAEKLLEENGA